MELTVSRESGRVVARTSGPIDEFAGDLFRKHLYPGLGESDTVLILDLSGSPYINSQGLGHLVALVAYANTKSKRAILCGVTPHVAGVIAVTKLATFFEIVSTLSDAVERIGT